MIYWDNAATTWPKPRAVRQRVGEALRKYGANPGRGGHAMSMATAGEVFRCREQAAAFFGLDDPAGVIFTAGCTASVNTVLHTVAAEGGRVAVSDLEHNAVVRALNGRETLYYDVAAWSPSPEETVENFRRVLRPDTRLILCLHASNVFGVTNPIRALGKLCRETGLLFAVDAAQSAGVLPINMEEDNIDYLCVAPHKGLYAPMGTGLLLCRKGVPLHSLTKGGTGSFSMLETQPTDLPEGMESGTVNVPGICGISAGIEWLTRQGRENVYAHEWDLMQELRRGLGELDRLQIRSPEMLYGKGVPVLSVTVDGIPPEEVAYRLDSYGVATRAGLHCAPWAHRHFGTLPDGTVRLAPSAFSTREEVRTICKIFLQILRK